MMQYFNLSNRKIFLLTALISAVVFVFTLVRTGLDMSFFLGLIFEDAKGLAYSGIIASDFMPIGYTALLALYIKIGGIAAIPAFQAVVYIASLFLAFRFLQIRGARGFFLALGILAIAFHPVFLLNNWRIHDGNLTAFLIIGFLVAGISYLRSRSIYSILALGFLTGLLFVVRVNTIVLIFPALLLFYNGGKWAGLKNLGRVMVFIFVAIMIFMSLNLSIKGRPFFFPQHGFYNLFSGTNEYSSKYLIRDFSGENSHTEALEARGFSSVTTFEERLAFSPEKYKKLAIDYIKENPLEYVKLTGLKIFTLFRPGYHVVENFAWNSAEGVKRLFKIMLALPVFIWMFFVYRDRKRFFERENIFIFLVAGLYLLPFFIANADPRYRFPIDLVFILDSFSKMKTLPFFNKD